MTSKNDVLKFKRTNTKVEIISHPSLFEGHNHNDDDSLSASIHKWLMELLGLVLFSSNIYLHSSQV